MLPLRSIPVPALRLIPVLLLAVALLAPSASVASVASGTDGGDGDVAGSSPFIEGETDLPPKPPAPPPRGTRGGLTIAGLEKLYTVAPGSTTMVRVTVTTSSGRPAAGRTLHTYYWEYQGQGERSKERLLTAVTTNAKGRARVAIHAPFSTFGYGFLYYVDVLSRSGSILDDQKFKVKVDGDLPAGDPSAQCSGEYPGPSLETPQAPSFYAVSLVPCDVPGVDQTQALKLNLSEVTSWFAGQTVDGVAPQWLRDGDGSISIAHVVVPFTRYEFGQGTTYPRLEAWIEANLPRTESLAPVVFADTYSDPDDVFCGVTDQSGPSPMLVIPQRECSLYPEEFGDGGQKYIVEHEMTHAFGAVPDCAPHYDGTGHVNDGQSDVLYQGDLDRIAPLVLDQGHDDYYLTNIPDCPDIADSPYWTSPTP